MAKSVKVADDLHAALTKRASEEDRAISTIIRRAFNLYTARPFTDKGGNEDDNGKRRA